MRSISPRKIRFEEEKNYFNLSRYSDSGLPLFSAAWTNNDIIMLKGKSAELKILFKFELSKIHLINTQQSAAYLKIL